ncbi:MAG TPA: hypothetical protein VM348_00630 [Brevundimonas sp.]|nr:hypothetical protein [Brevundimonas sp.]
MNHSNPWTFEAASEFWTAWNNKDVEAAGVSDQFQNAEQSLLSYEARTLEEAALQLSVVIDAMVGGGRSDGLDIAVVRRTQALMRKVGQVTAAPEPLARSGGDLSIAHSR